jgi:hypothetical protein
MLWSIKSANQINQPTNQPNAEVHHAQKTERMQVA